ncbi:Transducin beta-like protein 3 [Pseudolycoriella hygida]|uniref:Transducin beta-like protein 3 n=1 Tax=Pseudolycoriella hygida TaxID=35572 RepID=A0A9Q0S9C4_9DIPT|nr:Transducin beta-like protein 3 [Pseudolycoriella hygida]
MASRIKLKETFIAEAEYGAFYTGGAIAWTSDGLEILCQNSGKISIISTEDNKPQRSIGDASTEEVDEDAVYTFALSYDNELVVSSHKSGLLKLWNRGDGTMVKMWKAIHQGPIPQLAFGYEKQIIASGGTDSKIRLWDYNMKTCLGTLRGCQGVISVLQFHPDTNLRLIIAAADDNKIHGWNYETKELLFSLSGHFSKVTSLSFTKDSLYMVSTGRDKVLILWNLNERKAVRTVPAYEGVECAVIIDSKSSLPDDVRLDNKRVYAAAAGENGFVKIWDMTGGKTIFEQKNSLISKASEEGGLACTRILLNEKTSQLALVSVDQNIMIHNLSTFFCSKQLIGFTDEILDVAFLGKKGRYLAVATNSVTIKVYDTTNMNCRVLNGHTDIVLSLSTHKNFLLSSSKDQTIKLWEIDPGSFIISLLATGTKHTSSVGSVAFGKTSHILCASVSQDNCLKVWTIPKDFDKSKVISMNCTATQIAHEKDVNCVTISSDDKMIATGSQDKTAKLWSAIDLSLMGVFRGHKRGIWCVRFSPVDKLLLTTSADCFMKLWSIKPISCTHSFEGHDSSILKAEFLNHGLQILSAGSDGLLKVWSIKTSECNVTLEKHDGRIWAVAVAYDEKTFYSGGSDSLLVKWKDVTEEKKLEEKLQKQQSALEEQELSSLLVQKKMVKALRLALHLDKPLLSLKIINEVINSKADSELTETIEKLSDPHKEKLLNHATTWNTNSKNTRPAQLVLQILMQQIVCGKFKPLELNKLVEHNIPYTDRHFKRMTEYLKDIKFLEYSLRCMQPHVNFDAEMK